MTRTERTERALARRWRPLALLCWLVALSGAVVIVWGRIDASDTKANQLAAESAQAKTEADKRGTAVSTLAGDVRALRAQVKASGKTPVAPDPSRTVDDLPARVEVPVPIPGARGPAGSQGPQGEPGKDGVQGSPGVNGSDGVPGPAGPQGEQGPAGPQGPTGQDGKDGRDGQTCPDGYSLQPPADDPDALVCRRDGAPQPDPSQSTTPPVVLSDRRRTV